MVTEKQSRIIHYLVLLIATTVSTNEVHSVPLVTTDAPTPIPKGPSPGPPTAAPHEPLVAKSPLLKVADGPPPSHPAPHPPADDSTIAPGVARPSISIAPLLVATTSSKAGVEKMDLWLAPICEQLEKIVPKQAFKIQSQFKRIVELTNGKLSICFLEHYKIDPSLNPISKAQMTNLCHSRNSPHFRAFLACAAENWDVLAEKELDAITNARDDHIKNHKHDHKDGESGAPSLLHGDDEVKSILNDVVSRALSDNKSDHGKKSAIKMIDLSDKGPAGSSSSPVMPRPSAPSGGSPVVPAKSMADVLSVERKILNDPNTVMVFMDDSKPLHPPDPTHHSTNLFGAPTVSTTAIPHSNDKAKPPPAIVKAAARPHEAPVIKESVQTTSKPVSKDAHKPPPPPPTTMKPALSTTKKPYVSENATTSASEKPAPKLAKQYSSTVAPIKSSPKPNSKDAGEPSSRGAIESHPAAATTTTTVTPKSTSTTNLPTKTPTERPLETLEIVLKRQEAEKIEFEKKLKMEREALIRKLQKKQDEMDAQNAIAAMQSHRSHATDHDSRMHQIEHERQMSMDPIGHTLKHQQFEMRRQQRFGG